MGGTGSRDGSRRGTSAVVVLGIGLLALVAYGGSLQGEFVWDDRPLILEDPRIRDADRIGELLTSSFWETGDSHDRFRSFFRPLVSVTYLVDRAAWGGRPLGFRLTNLWLHLVCCGLVYGLARGERLPVRAAFMAAGLFAVHPVHVESVAWVSGRTDVLCAALLLGAFLLHRRSEGWWWRAASLALFAAALLAKEMAATLPLLILADRWLAGHGPRSAARAAWPYFGLLLLYLGVRGAVLGVSASPPVEFGLAGYAATAIFVLARYLTLLFLPVGLDAHYPYEPLPSLLSAVVLLAGGMLLVGWFGGRRLARGIPAVSIWLVWLPITILPVLAFGRFGDVVMADRFLYVPSVGFCLVAAHALARLERVAAPQRRRAVVAAAALTGVLLGLGVASHVRGRIWKSDLALFSDMLRTSPGSALVRCNLGLALHGKGDLLGAEREYRRAIALVPGYSMAHNNLAVALELRGRAEEALRHYRVALELAPGQIEAGTNAGHLMTRIGREEEGLARLRRLVRDHPTYARGFYALAEALERTGRSDEALGHLRHALELDPDFANPYYLLGKILLERGETRESRRAMRAFLERWPVEDDAWAEAARSVLQGVRRPPGLPAGADLPRS